MNEFDDIVIFKNDKGEPSIKVKLHNDTLWLNQYQISELFKVDRTSIVRHIKNIYNTEELNEKSTCAFFAQVQKEGSRKS